jgi:hypothetical protein
MTDNKPNQETSRYTDLNGGIEAHIIADMLRIESITTEMREFKANTNQRLDKLDKWIVGIVGVTVTTLLSVIAGIIINAVG